MSIDTILTETQRAAITDAVGSLRSVDCTPERLVRGRFGTQVRLEYTDPTGEPGTVLVYADGQRSNLFGQPHISQTRPDRWTVLREFGAEVNHDAD